MNWEAVTAISSALTGLVILLTVIYAARQVSALNEQSEALGKQLQHLRRATQLDGTLAVFEQLFSQGFFESYNFVITEFEELMKNETFREGAISSAPDTNVHKEREMMRSMERLATLIRNDLLEGTVILDAIADIVRETWYKLEPLVLEQRRVFGSELIWENYEYLMNESVAFVAMKTAQKEVSAAAPEQFENLQPSR